MFHTKNNEPLKSRYIHRRIVLLLSMLCISITASGQSFEEGVERYDNGQFEEAVAIFTQLNSAEALLFTGKSYYNLGQYLRARSYLNQLPEGVPGEMQLDAAYTGALIDFHLNKFGSALNALFRIRQDRPRSQLGRDANRLYDEILDYLTLAQRKEAYFAADHIQVKTDIIRSALGKVDYLSAKILLDQYRNTVPMDRDSSAYKELQAIIGDSLNYAYQIAFGSPLKAPRGTVYNIGAALPRFDNSAYEFSVTRGLYFGYLLAAEEFNQRNTDQKAFIRYQNTGASMDSAGYAISELAWNYNIDALIGPLYSKPARKVVELAEQYQIPLLAPLANADSLNLDNPYVYQANPTFGSHGRKMARFAVQNLGMDTLAVLAEKNSLGAASAYAFREEVERLGAHIAHFFVEDLKSKGYEISEYTKYFTGDVALIDSMDSYHHLDGLYAPFTGEVAPTLIDLLLVDLAAKNRDLTVLGSPTWGDREITEQRTRNRTIFFSESFYVNSKSKRVEQFNESFKNRFGIEASRFAMIGYDSADFLLRVLERIENPALLKDALKRQPLYEGLISNINFNGTHVNQEVKVFKMSEQGIQPAVY